jgi:uncharacterized protein (UPF0332 family)
MQPLDLIRTARRLSRGRSRGRPRQADLRRAVSTAYYALFHALCRLCADALIGTGASRNRPAWKQVYRALEHRDCKKRCSGNLLQKGFPAEVQHFCEIFVQLQDKRHKADYAPDAYFTLSNVEQDIFYAEEAIHGIAALSAQDKKAFAIWVLLKQRP